MWKSLLPVGIPTYFYGDILKIDPNAFGFFYCKIIAPDDIKHPILQTHVKTAGGKRTLSPIGTWEDMLFSEEIINAKKYGYQIEVLWGYTFEKECIFKNYVDQLYTFRLNYPKSNPMNFIAKILLNSLYGRFGMDDNFLEVNIIHKDFYPDFENKFFDQIVESKDLGNYKLVTYKFEDDLNNDSTHLVSIGVATAVTAYSRIHMSQFKNNPKINLYYTDTDSIYTDSDIDDNLIDNKVLGKLKLENICNKAIFLAPKVYCLETLDMGVVYKVKGLKHEIELTMSDFEKLLYKQSILQKAQTKFMRNISDGNIKLLDQVYTLQVTDNKRKLIYDSNKWISTKAYKISYDKDIRNN
jgi:DNA polymerase type B, organellar and viral